MELVEGEDSSQRIARGPIPLDEALPIAKQIAEALEAAHEQGHHPSRSEAREHQGPARRHGEGARLRPGQGAGAAAAASSSAINIADAHRARDDAGGHDSRHGGLHEPEQARGKRSTSARTSGRSAACSTKC